MRLEHARALLELLGRGEDDGFVRRSDIRICFTSR
jgi:hypothetical protein